MRTLIVLSLLLACIPLLATPSTLVYIPSTDIQPKGTLHLGADTYMFLDGGNSATLTDIGLTYGVTNWFEVGADAISGVAGAKNPVWFNAKMLVLKPTKALPLTVAVGGYNAAVKSKVSNQGMLYGVASYPLPLGIRATAGGYTGQKSGLGEENSGYLLGLDKTLGKWWYGADFQSGKNAVGAANVGIGYTIDDKTSVILGYDHYNLNALANSVNFQVDINL